MFRRLELLTRELLYFDAVVSLFLVVLGVALQTEESWVPVTLTGKESSGQRHVMSVHSEAALVRLGPTCYLLTFPFLVDLIVNWLESHLEAKECGFGWNQHLCLLLSRFLAHI